MKRIQSAKLAPLCWMMALSLSACSGSHNAALDAGGGGGDGSGGSHDAGSGGAGGSHSAGSGGSSTPRDAGAAGSHAGSGGASIQVDAGGVMCGKMRCPVGLMCCPGCNPGEESCGTACPGFQCPVNPVGVACGATTCAIGLLCCDHCIGSCVGATSGAFCPDDHDANRACDDGGAAMCAQFGESCLDSPCCTGLQCCSGVPIPPGEANCWSAMGACPMSDYHIKDGFSAVESDAVLEGVLALPLSKWHYKTDSADVQHIGPMAQDFKATFGVGADDKHIFQVDADGVSYAAIQALARRIERLSAAQEAMARENAALREQFEQCKKRGD